MSTAISTMSTSAPARPFAKMAGGKTKLISTILEILPKTFTRYFEPFVGGGAVFFGIQAAKPGMLKSIWLNDANEWLMNTYSAIRYNVEAVIKRLETPRYANTSEAYYQVRSECFLTRDGENAQLQHCRHAAEFIYLNKTGFNGLFRVNGSGGFNVPFGRYENPTICDKDNLRACARALKPVVLGGSDFTMATENAPKGSVVYLDPPYVPASKTADFTKYTANGFGPDDHIRLRDMALKLKKHGVFVLLSNSDTPFVRGLYSTKDWTLHEVRMARNINSKGDGRGKVGELLIY